MITKFTNYITKLGKSKESQESKKSIDYLETLIPDQLGKLLHDEIYLGIPDVQFIQNIITVGCPIDVRGLWNWSPLHLATFLSKFDVMKFLVQGGADINARNNHNLIALHYAAIYGNLKLMEFLISKGADIHARDIEGWTALHFAAQNGYIDAVKLLISNGADINVKDINDQTAWEYATAEIKEFLPELNPNK